MMNAIWFEKGKVAFQLLLIVSFQWSMSICQLNIYDTDQTLKSNSLQYDCLNYHVYREKLVYQELSDVVDEMIPYCFRPEINFDKPLGTLVNPLSDELNFEGLRLANITSQQLLSWSISIDVAERYQSYLNEPNLSLNEHVYNCTKPWFGDRCQYSFEFHDSMSFNEIVEAAFLGRTSYSESSDMIVQMPCYVFLECHRNGQFWCLDWREVCDGKVDCYDEDIDETYCVDMEINECEENEYRCHNGICISHELWEEGEGDADCLDRSDEIAGASYIKSCFQDPTFRCEEHACRPNDMPFSCGNGQCVLKFDKCHNGRHILLIDSMIVKGNLTDECWIAMVCLTGLVNKINRNVCTIWLMNYSAYELLKQCDSFFQFPIIPVHYAHIRFFYENLHLRSPFSDFYLPDYICFDQQLCDSIIPQLVHENLTCLQNHESLLELATTNNPWIAMNYLLEKYFRHCLTHHVTLHDKSQYSNHRSLYHCKNSSKFISVHRILDGATDCFLYDDEDYNISCLFDHSYRVRCGNADECLSPLLTTDYCSMNVDLNQKGIPFQRFCDGIKQHFFYDNNKNELNDEDECEDWCNNMYARCDGYWACSDGRDENDCRPTKCHSGTYACVSSLNYTVMCLPWGQVNDRKIDNCLGTADEQEYCRVKYPSSVIFKRFRCSNDTTCIRSSELCDNKPDCPRGDDEEFCKNLQFTCNKGSGHTRSEVEQVLCGLSEDENGRISYFSVHTSSNYPPFEANVANENIHWPVERRPIIYINASRVENSPWPWYCNRGLVVRTWIENNSYHNSCMCPPSYYGHLCQYQNQRISLTLRLSSIDRHATYAVVIMLVDDNDEQQKIDAYEQFLYVAKRSCSIKLNRYLLFPTRPKNISKNYSVRIDTFEKNEMGYVGSWHFPITFLFLPVNRLAVSLVLSNHRIHTSPHCSFTCNKGECVKYYNKDKYFCRCFPGWSGIQCNIPMHCETCLAGSICIESTNDRSICVCPLDKSGPRCLLTSTCPANACQNNGQCIPADVSIPGSDYTCICSDRFHGTNCQYSKAKLDVSLNKMPIPSYLVAYFFTLSNQSEPINTIVLRKLTLFQHIVTFQITVLFHMVIIKASDKYYLAVLQQSPKIDMSTLINPAQECIPGKQLLNYTVLEMVQYQRIVFYYELCRTRHDLTCFIDEVYLCLCTNDRHANCMEFDRVKNFQCLSTNDCKNGATCLQDHPTCPSTRICICPSCFFGSQCQFYAKGLGSTLDEILGYEFKRNTILTQQPLTVQVSVATTMLIFIIGITNGIVSITTFARKKSQEVGCGIYLLASSVTSSMVMILFALKIWFIFISHQDLYGQPFILNANCLVIEPLLKMILYADNWLNACVAIERAFSVYQGISFDKNNSKRVAKRVIILLFIIIISLFIPQFLHLRLFNDEKEERSWCVITSSPWLRMYSSVLISFHYFGPLLINIFTSLFIIISTTRRGAVAQRNRSLWIHLKSKLNKYKHLLISPAVITILTLPYVIISVILDCKKSSDLFWFYLIGYFFSFIPASFIFFIFVLPSPLYKKEYDEMIARFRRRLNVLTMSFNSG